MPTYRMQVSMGADDPFPASKIINTIHLLDNGLTTDPENLCEDLATLYETAFLNSTTREVKVTAYEVGPPPQLPVASVTHNAGVCPVTNGNREIACCLSYYNERSNPRKRGRLYMPAAISPGGAAAARPASTLIGDILDLGDGLAALGGLDVDWVVYSPTSGQTHPVVGTWVDNAWDVVRSRGLDPTARTERTPGS